MLLIVVLYILGAELVKRAFYRYARFCCLEGKQREDRLVLGSIYVRHRLPWMSQFCNFFHLDFMTS